MMVKYSTNINNLSHKFTEYTNTVTYVDGNSGPGIDHWDSTTSLTIGSKKKEEEATKRTTHTLPLVTLFSVFLIRT